MRDDDGAVEVLALVRELGDKTDEMNALLERTNARFDQTNAKIESVRQDLGRAISESGRRTTAAIVEVSRGLTEFLTELKGDRFSRAVPPH